jgi:sarcosine oxidase/L-pipecolate oxidase
MSSAKSICRRHSFKVLPNIGKHVVELIEGSLSRDLAYAWRWRPAADADALKSRRAAAPKDLADMLGWKHEKEAQGNGRKAMNSCTGT